MYDVVYYIVFAMGNESYYESINAGKRLEMPPATTKYKKLFLASLSKSRSQGR